MDAADGFAELMRELKERSGLSYGALAKRLHVSTSTLHRYCNGDAVPTGFAPVERLGRLCGASRDELVELHRCWIVADEARRRGKGEPAEAVGEAATPAGAAAPEAVAPEAVAPEGVAPEGAAPEGADLEGAAPERQPVPDAAPLVTAQAPPARRSRKPLLVLLAATAAVVGLALPTAYVLQHKDDTPAAAEDGAAESGPPAPLSVGISSYNWAEPCGQYYVLDQQPGHVPPPPPPQDTRGWARALGGTDGGHMQLQLTVTGRTQAPVVLSKLNVRVVERGEPLDGAVYSMADGCGSGITPQTFDLDLDAPRPFLKPVAGHDADRVVPAKDFPYQVATGDAQVLNLDVHTEKHVSAWYLELEWSSGAQRGTVRVDDGGEPFRTSAIEGRPTYGWWPEKGTWVKQ
ncbi:helix-turn-helix domain-containing protein [Streptomyces sp. NPDC085481]|uniref:helix-turn-helix domain-containing protein n=1 Tax=Streptomyces sp. NPDC085481 TaxID=3365727 RepID=UPI0037D3B3AA